MSDEEAGVSRETTSARKPSFDPIKELHELDGTEWTFGATSKPCLYQIPFHALVSYLPKGETQVGREDVQDCASRAPVNVLEAKFTYAYQSHLFKPENKRWLEDNGYVVDGRVLFSDAFVAINSGTTRQGNSLKAPVEAIRKQGLIPKKMLPLETWMTFDQYHDKSRITKKMQSLGAEFISRFTVNYEQVYESQFETFKEALDGAAYAWPVAINGIYPKTPGTPNHAFIFWMPAWNVFDNYPEGQGDYLKALAPDYDMFGYAYRVYISNETIPNIQLTVFQILKQKGLLAFFAEWRRLFSTS